MDFQISNQGGLAVVKLVGEVDRTIGNVLRSIRRQVLPGDLAFDCAQITRINSIGIADWTRAMREEFIGFRYRYISCTDQFIDAAVMIPLFPVDGWIESILYSLLCEDCDRNERAFCKLDDKTIAAVERPKLCPGCGQPMEIADNLVSNLETLNERSAATPKPTAQR